MALEDIGYGAIATSQILNDNFHYLDGRVDTVNGRVDTTNSNVTSLSNTVTNIQTTIGSIQNPTVVQLTGTTPTLTANKEHSIEITGNTTFTLPVITDATKFHQMLVLVDMPTAYTLNLGTSKYFYDSEPDMSSAGKYTLIYEYNGSNWVVGAMFKGEDE